MKNLGQFLKEVRTEKKLSLRDFAKLLNISHSYLDKLERCIDSRNNKEIEPTIDTLEKISAALGITLKELLIQTEYIIEEDSISIPENYNDVIQKAINGDYKEALVTARNLNITEKELIKLMRIYKED